MGRSWVRSRRCWGCNLVSAGVQRDRCDLGLGAVVRSGVRCGGAIWGCGARQGWMRWCDLGLWCARSRQLYSLLLLLVQSSFFSSRNGLKVSLETGFGPWGGTIWAGRSLAEVSLDMGFGSCEVCARAFSIQVWFLEIV